jgi:hypothetical protein
MRMSVDVTAPLRYLTRLLANRRRKIVLTPDFNSYFRFAHHSLITNSFDPQLTEVFH